MIIIRIWGGIGNQLFQYAFGEYLSLKYDQPVFYDLNSFGNIDTLRNPELTILNQSLPVYKTSIYFFSNYRGIRNRVLRIAFLIIRRNKFIKEASFNENDKAIRDRSKVIYLQGYWQCEKYANFVVQVNKTFFQPKLPIPLILKDYFELIPITSNSVSLHVRRGDYFSPENIKIYGVCDAAYYQNAVKEMLNNYPHARFIVFSDDLDWVKNNLILPADTNFIRNYAINPYWYIYLMSLCKHHIISNSSFSWWGAYLNSNISKTVISPKRWSLKDDKTIALNEWIKF